jgi:hypothetical protein
MAPYEATCAYTTMESTYTYTAGKSNCTYNDGKSTCKAASKWDILLTKRDIVMKVIRIWIICMVRIKISPVSKGTVKLPFHLFFLLE